MTHDELEDLIYERTRYFIYGSVVDCILELIAAEREACAKACEARKLIAPFYDCEHHYNQAAEHCAAAIRARGET